MSLPTKDELGAKLLNYPLLRQLLYERWFRLAFFALSFLFLFFALFLPKIWRTSRPDFRPVIKVSGLDLVQAWSLRRTAMKATAAGNFDEAHYAWQAALANNRADPDLVRGALRSLLQDPHQRQYAQEGSQEALWLLRLTGTNLVDLELAANVLEQFRHHELVLAMVEPHVTELTPVLAAVYLKALFDMGRVQAFQKAWDRLAQKVQNDPELALYRAAYLVGWGPPETMTSSREQIEKAAQDPGLRVVACRLKLILCAREMNAAEYGATLKKLEDWREDSLNYHVGYWRLLAATGDKAEAVRLAQGYPHPPSSSVDVVELAQVYSELDRRAEALQMLQHYAEQFGHAPIYWVSYANELIEAKRWEDLRRVALQIRSEEGVRDPLAAFSYFLEGRAELALGREPSASAAFRKAAEREFPFPALGQKVGMHLLQLGHADLAKQVLLPLEKSLQDETGYWVLVFAVADQLKDVDLLVKAAQRAYEISPKDPLIINNYAAALIISRQKPEEAIKLTLPFFSQNPTSLHALVNHSAALLLNDRPKEAHALLTQVRTNTLNPSQLALYNLDLFETYLGLRQYDRAWAIHSQIDVDRLYPTQRRWFQQASQALPQPAKPGSD